MDFSLLNSIKILERTPIVLRDLLTELSEEWIYSNEGADSWSPFEIVGHLIHGEDTDWIPRIKIILNRKSNPVFEPFDRFAQFKRFEGYELSDLLDLFSAKRNENLEMLRQFTLTDKELKLKGIHPELGEVTLQQLLAAWTVHDLAHINQISRVMAKQYSENVGPWYSYLPILSRA